MSNDDEELLLNIFPAEIWLLILKNVKDAKNYHICCSASPYFRNCLLPRAPELLFSQVAKPILYLLQGEEEGVSNTILVNKVCEYRGVCKVWKAAVDNILETQHFNPNFPSDHQNFFTTLEHSVDHNFEYFYEAEDFLNFREHFDSTHLDITSNPFLGRGICIYNDHEGAGELEEFYREGIRMLQKYGHHIWSCVIKRDEDFLEVEQIPEFYQKLRIFLKLMPNLKTLEVDTEFEADLPVQLLVTMQANMTANPFPTLPQLKHLTISGGNLVAVRALLQANPQVENLHAKSGCSPGVLKTLLKEGKMVKGLALQPISSPQLYSICKADVAAPVENLWLDTSKAMPQAMPEDWRHIFFAIEFRFSRNLRQLRLRLPKLLAKSVQWQLVLPQLKILDLEMEDLVPLDFLLLLKDTLEQLSLRVSATDPLQKEELSSLKLIQLERSNAWELFPKLRLLRTAEGTGSWNICTRHQWRKAQAT